MKINQGENVMLSREDYARLADKALKKEQATFPDGMSPLLEIALSVGILSALHHMEGLLFDEPNTEEGEDE